MRNIFNTLSNKIKTKKQERQDSYDKALKERQQFADFLGVTPVLSNDQCHLYSNTQLEESFGRDYWTTLEQHNTCPDNVRMDLGLAWIQSMVTNEEALKEFKDGRAYEFSLYTLYEMREIASSTPEKKKSTLLKDALDP